MLYDASCDMKYKGPGYHDPAKITKPLEGNDLYPAVFTFNMSTERTPNPDGSETVEHFFEIASRPIMKRVHWRTILKEMEVEKFTLALPNTVVHFYDPQIKYTYYLTRVDPLTTLVVIYEVKRRDKDPKVTRFLLDLAGQLRCLRIFASLKTGLKWSQKQYIQIKYKPKWSEFLLCPLMSDTGHQTKAEPTISQRSGDPGCFSKL